MVFFLLFGSLHAFGDYIDYGTEFKRLEEIKRDKLIKQALNTEYHDFSVLEEKTAGQHEQLKKQIDKPVIKESKHNEIKEEKPVRKRIIEEELDKWQLEVSIGYEYVDVEQEFSVINSANGQRISRLTYPAKGEIPAIKAEVSINDKFSISGRYAGNDLDTDTCSDEDWNIPVTYSGSTVNVDYQRTKQRLKSSIEMFDLDVYYKLFEESKDQKNQEKLFFTKLADVDRFSVELMAGYHQKKGTYIMTDPVSEHLLYFSNSWWTVVPIPYSSGLNSYYNIKYQGPKIGLRFKTQQKDKFISSFSIAYSHFRTKAYAYWNLRNYYFNQYGKNGNGLFLNANIRWFITPDWFCDIGYNYRRYRQKKMKESGNIDGYIYNDEDIIRDVDAKIHGPTIAIGYKW